MLQAHVPSGVRVQIPFLRSWKGGPKPRYGTGLRNPASGFYSRVQIPSFLRYKAIGYNLWLFGYFILLLEGHLPGRAEVF